MQFRFSMVLLGALSMAGCSTTGAYKPEYVRLAPMEAGRKVDGKALLSMLRSDASYVYKAHPVSFAGRATSLSLPLGVMTREIGKKVFTGFFTEGADTAESLSDAQAYRAAAQVGVRKFSHAYADSFWDARPQIEMELQVKFMDGSTGATWDKTFSSGKVLGDTFPAFSASQEPFNRLAHETLTQLLTQAAKELRSYLYSHPAEASSGSK